MWNCHVLNVVWLVLFLHLSLCRLGSASYKLITCGINQTDTWFLIYHLGFSAARKATKLQLMVLFLALGFHCHKRQ